MVLLVCVGNASVHERTLTFKVLFTKADRPFSNVSLAMFHRPSSHGSHSFVTSSVSVVRKMLVECGICFAKYREGELELHREMCVPRLVFRCILCNVDYMNKEGLWNHMDLHEISDEIKEQNYQEIKAKHKLHQCARCNDQRAYLEGPYREHIQDIHDGFFLRRSECGQYVRSEKLRNDHSFRHSSDQTESGDHEADQKQTFSTGNQPGKLSVGETSTSSTVLNSSAHLKAADDTEDIDIKTEITVEETTLVPIDGYVRSTADSCTVTELNGEPILTYICSHCGKRLSSAYHLSFHIQSIHLPVTCDICGITSSSRSAAKHHKDTKHKHSKYKCPCCSMSFLTKTIFKQHVSSCKEKKFSCDLCGQLFETRDSVKYHKRHFCCARKSLKKVQNRTKEPDNNEQNSSLAHDEIAGMHDTTDSSNVVEKVPQPLVDLLSIDAVQQKISPGNQPGEDSRQSDAYDAKLSVGETGTSSGQTVLNSSAHLKAADDTEDIDIKTEITVEETTLMSIDGYETSTADSCTVTELNGGPILTDRSDPDVAIEDRSGIKRIKCSHCPKKLARAHGLKKHFQNFHVPVTCDICGITLSSRSAVKHHKDTKHKESKYKCPCCSMSFLTKTYFKQHVSTCKEKKFSCDQCGQLFETRDSVNYHRRNFCCVRKTLKKAQNPTKEQDDTISSNLSTEDNNEQNSSSAHDEIAGMHDTTDSSNVVEKVPQPLVDSKLSETICSYCHNEFTSTLSLYRHLSNYHGRIKCNICGVSLLGLQRHKNHMLTCHAEPSDVCPTCGKNFSNRIGLYLAHLPICERRKNACEKSDRRDDKNEDDLANVQIDQVQNQAQDSDMKMEISVEESSLLSHDDQGQSSVNPTPIINSTTLHKNANDVVCSSEQSSSEIQAGSERISQPLAENSSRKLYRCNICEISLPTYHKAIYHKMTKHVEPKHKCPHCPLSFLKTSKYQSHLSTCEGRKFPCDVCGKKFKSSKSVANHEKAYHQACDANGSEEQQQKQSERIVFAKDITQKCTMCGKTFAGADELMDHKVICPQQLLTKHNHSQLGAKKISLLQRLAVHDVKEVQSDAMNMPQSENIELKMEPHVEDTMLQKYQVSTVNREKSSTTTLASQFINHDKSKDVGEILTASQSTLESVKHHGVSCDRNEPLVRNEVTDQLDPCSICGLTFANKPKMDYHMVVAHTEPRYKCSQCPKAFHFVDTQRRHEMIHRRLGKK